ncbi:MAG TPA: universal stress protein [Bacteroidia bacterium]
MKTILVPTDFSDCSKHAFESACSVARKTRSKIILLHVVSTPALNDNEVEIPYMMELLKTTKKKMKKLISEVDCEGIKVIDRVEPGIISDTINSNAKKFNADLIVMGSDGIKSENKPQGSSVQHVMRDAKVPVLAIKDGTDKYKISNIVFATDFSEEANLVFPFIKSFADIFGAQIHLLKVLTFSDSASREKAEIESKKFIKENKLENYPTQILHHIRSEVEGINRYLDMNDSDLVAIGTHGRHGIARLLRGSIAESVVNRSTVPVLTINFRNGKNGQQLNSKEEKIFNPHAEVQSELPFAIQVPSI